MTEPIGGEGYFATLKRLMVTLLTVGRTRFALLAVELEEEKARFVRGLLLAASALVFLILAIVAVMALVASLFWEQRVLVFTGFSLLLCLGGFVALKMALGLLTRPTGLFKSSLAELDADIEALRERSHESPP